MIDLDRHRNTLTSISNMTWIEWICTIGARRCLSSLLPFRRRRRQLIKMRVSRLLWTCPLLERWCSRRRPVVGRDDGLDGLLGGRLMLPCIFIHRWFTGRATGRHLLWCSCGGRLLGRLERLGSLLGGGLVGGVDIIRRLRSVGLSLPRCSSRRLVRGRRRRLRLRLLGLRVTRARAATLSH